jgi:hypothetical protein
MHVIVQPPLVQLSHGRITCDTDADHLVWTGPGGRSVQTDETQRTAYAVACGAYRIVGEAHDGERTETTFHVAPLLPDAVVVSEYVTSPASSTYARDGAVEAVGHGLDPKGRFLWTCGTETRGPVLRDCACGTYAAVPIAGDAGQHVLTFVQLCAPGEVRVA